jgi:glycine/D-amino acid oxidase-like deaminating enzyme
MRPETARRYDVTVVGGGLIGLATAYRLLEAKPGLRLAVLEKEPELARHQSGHNSGVIHAGLYYTPGSLKARLCREGWRDRLACDRQDACREGDRRLRAVRGMRYSGRRVEETIPGSGRRSREPPPSRALLPRAPVLRRPSGRDEVELSLSVAGVSFEEARLSPGLTR